MEPSGTSKRLRLRRPDRCVRCGREFSAGDEALWYRESRQVTFVECKDDASVDLEARAPGASAQREYGRRHQQREDYARQRRGRLGVVLARVIPEPQSTQAWQRGAKGETTAGARLEKHLAGKEVKLFHDRRVPGHGKANIDHIAIGPGGITVIDTKNYRGKVRVQKAGGLFSEPRTILSIGGKDRTRLLKAVKEQIELVRGALAGTDDADADIAGALCFANVDGLPLIARQELDGVLIDGARRVAKLARRPGDLDLAAIDRIKHRIGHAFPPA
jgi:Nuclease-related domain